MLFQKSLLALLTVFSIHAHADDTAKPAADSFVNPQVVEKMKQMGEYLRSLSKFQVDAQISRDHVLENGQKIKSLGTSVLTVDGKNSVHAMLSTDDHQREFFYNGKQTTIYSPALKYYATVDTTGSFADVFHRLEDIYDVQFPIEDLFNFGLNQDQINSLEVAAFVGPSKVNGKTCEHLAFRGPKLDWQLWVTSGKQPLPCKLVITTTDDSSQPEYEATYNWNLKPKIKANQFTFQKHKGDVAIPLQKKTE